MARNNQDITQRPWLKIEEVQEYVPLGIRSIRTLIKERRIKSVKPDHGPVLTKKEWIDEYLESCAENDSETHQIVEEMLNGR